MGSEPHCNFGLHGQIPRDSLEEFSSGGWQALSLRDKSFGEDRERLKEKFVAWGLNKGNRFHYFSWEHPTREDCRMKEERHENRNG